ncbi:MAG: carbon-phosphorus lyase complex subunit PhnI [Opitutaceae bacterium]
MLIQRRISSAFREIPGGQILGPTRDYSQRLLEAALATESAGAIEEFLRDFEGLAMTAAQNEVRSFGKVTDLLRNEGLLRAVTDAGDRRVVDITREPLRFPAPRSARLQALARAETGAIMALAYAGMRGQGGDHPTIGEVRVGLASLHVTDPRGRRRHLGRVQVTESENISKIKVKKKNPVPYMSLGYGLCFGQNETTAICMGMLDRGVRIQGGTFAPATSDEFALYHTEGADVWGALRALERPARVEFESELDLLRAAVMRKASRDPHPVPHILPRPEISRVAAAAASRVFHISDRPGIAQFEPRPPPSLDAGVTDHVVWAIGERLLHNYLLPRDCPRVTFHVGAHTREAGEQRFFAGTTAKHVVAIESAWLERVRCGRVWLYELPADTFACIDAGADYHVSRIAVAPRSVTEVADIPGALAAREVELRILPSVWKLRDAVLASTLAFSFIRMRNAQPRPVIVT